MATARHHRSGEGLLSQRSLPLTELKTPPKSRTAVLSRRLWFCVYLPDLPLEASGFAAQARAVVEEQQGIHRVLLACPEALAAGIMPGQSANAALALLPTVRIEERSHLREQQALEALATWLEQFTSVVCIAGPDVLLLEIAGSLRLYGGLLSLRQQLAAGLRQQGFGASLAIAPTPLAATWLARAGRRACIRDSANMVSALRSLPLACLGWPAATCAALTGMGVASVGDCLRLPREGFARRFGVQRLIELDRALGRLPDPRTAWRAPERFCVDYEMTEEQSDREILLAICHELLFSLERFLLTRQLGTQRLLFSFFHLRGPATQLVLGCAGAERLAGHWFDLLKLRFERVTLPEPVIAVRLYGGRNQALHAESRRLAFHGKASGQRLRYSMSQLAERLAARVGNPSVQGVTTVAEHRPQRAWCLQSLLGEKAGTKLATIRHSLKRPLWILPEPALLPLEQAYPVHQGRLTLLEGPERLETGWWDEDGIARDYYTAVNPYGMRLWVYQNRNRTAAWYLHGFFG
ncbi:MAG: DNA polymerase Y family protein [Gammaproteobacteria bacterium]|nr:DNA polymerase Y family protein [Gammaproteobacteria bacterium]